VDGFAVAFEVDFFPTPVAGLTEGEQHRSFVAWMVPTTLINLRYVAAKRLGSDDAVLLRGGGVEIGDVLVVIENDDGVADLLQDFAAKTV
jgi:hypothetical protein